MKFAFSNIAWPKQLDRDIATLLSKNGIDQIEIAPTLSFEGNPSPDSSRVQIERKFWESYGISIVALQSLLFGRPELQIFGDEQSRNNLISHLYSQFNVAAELGATKLVFGSPKNRVVPEGMPNGVAWDIALNTFNRLGELAKECGVTLCIEPNPSVYGCNFITNANEGLRFANEVDSKGIGLHLDTACMALSGDPYEESIVEAGDLFSHIHLSAAGLGPLEDFFVDHKRVFSGLQQSEYKGTVSVEMRSKQNHSAITTISSSIKILNYYYRNETEFFPNE